MINEEIKFINDGYLYDQDEQKLYDVSGNIRLYSDRLLIILSCLKNEISFQKSSIS